jgi:signal transduction histidine kinase
MNRIFQSLYGKVSAVFLVLLLVLGIVQILLSVNASLNFVRESDQQLNRNLASDLAKTFKPFLQDSVDIAAIEHTFHELMVMNPRVELYLLNERGGILAFFAPPEKVKRKSVALAPIQAFLQQQEAMPVLGDDPRSPDKRKPFSVTPVKIGNTPDGYLYVILGGEQYDSASAMIRESYIVRTTAIGLIVTLIFTGIIGLILFSFLTKRFNRMSDVVRRFKKGDYGVRIKCKSRDEIGQLANSFDQMADTIVTNMAELRQTDNLRRELIANVSHDLRSPLASIQGYLETILMKDETLKPDERRHYLKTIFDNSVSLTKLVDELFELSKLDAKQIKPKRERFSIAELVQDVVMKFRPEAEKLDVRLEATLPQDLPMVNADIGMIERALSNLIDNAIRYTPAEGQVHVDLKNNTHSIKVTVADTGCGIPKEELPNVFERFYRVEKSRSRLSGGTGLGLAIAKRILDLHDSTISIDSEINKGTRLVFELPAIDRVERL